MQQFQDSNLRGSPLAPSCYSYSSDTYRDVPHRSACFRLAPLAPHRAIYATSSGYILTLSFEYNYIFNFDFIHDRDVLLLHACGVHLGRVLARELREE